MCPPTPCEIIVKIQNSSMRTYFFVIQTILVEGYEKRQCEHHLCLASS